MISYASNLWKRTDCVIRQAQSRRQELYDFIEVFAKRAEAEDAYAKALDLAYKGVQKYIHQNSLASLTYSAIKFGMGNRATEARNFARQLRDEIITLLKDVYTKQQNEGKQAAKQIKKLERELESLHEAVIKSRARYVQYFNDWEGSLIGAQVANFVTNTPKDKKVKMVMKSKDIMKDLKEYHSVMNTTINDHNRFIDRFHTQITKNLDMLQTHEAQRLQLQVDCIMKTLIFETSMVKNFEYDIVNVSQQMQNGKKHDDIQQFIKENQLESDHQQRIIPALPQKRLSIQGILDVVENRLQQKVQLERSKELRDFIMNSLKNEPMQQLSSYTQDQVKMLNSLSKLVWRCWQGDAITEDDKKMFKNAIDDEKYRHFILMCLQTYHQMNRLEIPQQSYDQIVKMYVTLLNKSIDACDVYVMRKLINLAFYYFKREGTENKVEGKELGNKYLLARDLELLDELDSRDLWQVSIFQAIQEQLILLGQKPAEPETQIMREKTAILGQLASFCHQMVMMGMEVKQVRLVVGKFCRLYDISEEEDRDLSRSIAAAVKAYKELKGSTSVLDSV